MTRRLNVPLVPESTQGSHEYTAPAEQRLQNYLTQGSKKTSGKLEHMQHL